MLKERNDISLISVILPRHSAEQIVAESLHASIEHILVTDARGTLIRDRWYQFLLPLINPGQEIVHILARNQEVDTIMSRLTVDAKLYRSGNGAIFVRACPNAWLPDGYLETDIVDDEDRSHDELPFKSNLTSIHCIAQKEVSGLIARAAVGVGSPGPTIRYCRGEGVRSRLGLLRVAVSPDKEHLEVLVDSVDRDVVFDAMIEAGGLDRPGGGFIYMTPVIKGMNKIQGVYSGTRHGASIPQIIQAIDELKQSSDWRAASGYSETGKRGRGLQMRKYLTGSRCLRCIIDEKDWNRFVHAGIKAGAPGVSVTFGREVGAKDLDIQKSGLALVRGKAVLESILAPKMLPAVLSAWREEAQAADGSGAAFYSLDVPKAFTYLG